MTARKTTHHPILRWLCPYCKGAGEVVCDRYDTADTRWARVADAHREHSIDCFRQYGDSGVAVAAEEGHLPE